MCRSGMYSRTCALSSDDGDRARLWCACRSSPPSNLITDVNGPRLSAPRLVPRARSLLLGLLAQLRGGIVGADLLLELLGNLLSSERGGSLAGGRAGRGGACPHGHDPPLSARAHRRDARVRDGGSLGG